MGWLGDAFNYYHLYEFDIKEEIFRIANDVESYEENKFYKSQYKNVKLGKKNDILGIIKVHLKTTIRQPKTIKIDKYIEKYGTLHYTHVGDDWKYLITLEAIIEDYHYGYTTIIDREGNCLPT